VRDDINQKVEPHVPLPDLVNATPSWHDWEETSKTLGKRECSHTPVMITVANLTYNAARVD